MALFFYLTVAVLYIFSLYIYANFVSSFNCILHTLVVLFQRMAVFFLPLWSLLYYCLSGKCRFSGDIMVFSGAEIHFIKLMT